jgi:hypothetical protein
MDKQPRWVFWGWFIIVALWAIGIMLLWILAQSHPHLINLNRYLVDAIIIGFLIAIGTYLFRTRNRK